MSKQSDSSVYESTANADSKPSPSHRPFSRPKFKGKPKKQPPASSSLAAPLPEATVNKDAFKPKALAVTATQPKNDPLWLDFEDHGFAGLTPYRAEKTFAVTFEGFIPFVEREYDLIGSTDRTFTKYVSKAMWTYYTSMHLFARVIAIRDHKGMNTHNECNFKQALRSDNYPVPACIDEYLRSIGCTTDMSQQKFQITFPAWPNLQGHFHRISAATHWKYESMPAPKVLSERIKQDMNKTINPAANADWEIDDIRPADENCGLPTANLLGWARSTTLTTEQLSSLQGCGITPDDFPVDFPQFQLNNALFSLIADKVRMLERHLKLGASIHESANGSIAQTLWVTRDVNEAQSFNRTKHYAESELSVRSNTQHDKRVAIGALITSFRVRKEPLNNEEGHITHPWSCYDYGNYVNVPNDWIATRNHIFEHGDTAEWNLQGFPSAFTSKDPLRTSWQRKGLVRKTSD